ncbi:MAG: DAK2 domain-containing protein [Anaerolineales bacterium]|nr:MAG: DAK2 domain-containing protein [Anaerolineales bacterium]
MVADSPESTKLYAKLRKLPLNGPALKKLIEAGLTWLRTNQQIVNSLNVFPVPDGDTGTNMVLTMQSAYDEIANSPEYNFGKMAHALAHGALMGARGNSGVILSQIWRGFARSVDHIEILDAPSLVHALVSARDTAYKGVVRPVEGTILTVIKDIAAAGELALQEFDNPTDILEKVVDAAHQSVQYTPELLPVLKEAGVVDAGGKGLFFILEGMVRHIKGLPLDTALTTVQPLAAMKLDNAMEAIEPGQDFEVVVDFQPRGSLDLEGLYNDLEAMGTSIQLGEGDGIYRLHIHVPTEKRYAPIDYTMSLGTITKVSMENLLAQMESIAKDSLGSKLTLAPVEPGQIAVVAVSPGVGLSRVFASLGAAAIIEGGQTMNPSTQEILAAFENLPTDQIVILPNNKNIVLAARSAGELTVKQVAIVPSHSIPQGLSALLRLDPNGDFDQVVNDMNRALDDVESGEITVATRSVEIDGVQVTEGQAIALHNGKLILAADSIEDACLRLLKQAHADHFELITMYGGIDLVKAELYRLADLVRQKYPEQEIEVQEGGQPHYQLILSIE